MQRRHECGRGRLLSIVITNPSFGGSSSLPQ
jgi:hypothetical protein